MKWKYLVWFLAICMFVTPTVLSQQQEAKPVRPQAPDNLTRDVMLVPVEESTFAAKLATSNEPFTINPDFDRNVTAQQQAVIRQAINEWTAIIRTRGFTPGNYPIRFFNGPRPDGNLALTTTNFGRESGNLSSASIEIDDDGSTTWYIDPNPADDDEFRVAPPAGVDLLTVVRHEIGHAVGFADTRRMTALISGDVFDPTHLNIGTVGGDGGRHTDPNVHAGDIMNPGLPASVRRPISLYPAASMVAKAFFYGITMNFVRSAYYGTETGSANEPWNTVREGADLAPFGQLLLAPGVYYEAVPLTLSRPMTITVARGGAALIK